MKRKLRSFLIIRMPKDIQFSTTTTTTKKVNKFEITKLKTPWNLSWLQLTHLSETTINIKIIISLLSFMMTTIRNFQISIFKNKKLIVSLIMEKKVKKKNSKLISLSLRVKSWKKNYFELV